MLSIHSRDLFFMTTMVSTFVVLSRWSRCTVQQVYTSRSTSASKFRVELRGRQQQMESSLLFREKPYRLSNRSSFLANFDKQRVKSNVTIILQIGEYTRSTGWLCNCDVCSPCCIVHTVCHVVNQRVCFCNCHSAKAPDFTHFRGRYNCYKHALVVSVNLVIM